MLNRDIIKLLEYEINKKPALKNIYDNIDDYSENDIDNIPFLKWMRDALKKYKASKDYKQHLEYTEANTITVEISPSTSHEDGIVYQKDGDEWVRSLSSMVLIPHDAYLFVSGDHMWWGATYFEKVPNIKMKKIAGQNRNDYILNFFN